MTVRIEPPKLSGLYRRALVDAVKAKISSNGSLGSLPDEAFLADHPGVTEDHLEQYRQLFNGEVFDGVHRRSLPSVLIHIAAFPVQMALMGSDDFPLQLMGLVHLSNEVEHHQPIVAGQPLQIRTYAENLRGHRRGTQVDIITEVFSGATAELAQASEAPGKVESVPGRVEGSERVVKLEEVLWRSTSTYLSRGVYVSGEASEEDQQGSGRRGGRRDFTPPRQTAAWQLDAGIGRDYAAVSGDYNPIHLSSVSAKVLGMQRAIAHGMYGAGRMLEGREPEQAGHRWYITFEAPVTLPATVAFGVEKPDERTQVFTGWNPKTRRRHFRGELQLP